MYIDLFAHLRSGGYEFLGKDFRGEALQFNATLKSQVEHGADVPRWHRKTIWLVEKFNEAVRNTTHADLTIDRYA